MERSTQNELREDGPPSLPLHLADALSRAFLHLEAADRAALGALHPPLTTAQFHALAALEALPGTGLQALARRMLTAKGNASVIVDRLVAQRLVVRNRDPRDARRIEITLTAAGAALLERAREARAALLDAALAPLPAGEQEALLSSLLDLTSLLRDAAQQHDAKGSP